jgi:hypothetical protein
MVAAAVFSVTNLSMLLACGTAMRMPALFRSAQVRACRSSRARTARE